LATCRISAGVIRAMRRLICGGWGDPAVPQQLFAKPHHLAFGAFEAEVELAEHIIAGAAQFGGVGARSVMV
jgi:hypothetical protein